VDCRQWGYRKSSSLTVEISTHILYQFFMKDIDIEDYLSQEGYDELSKRLDGFRKTRRIAIAERLEYAKSLGDLSENAEYAEAKEEQMSNEAEIAKLEDLLSRAKILKPGSASEVRVGATVFCNRTNNGKVPEQFMIVGREEADPTKGKISNESPLGHAFLGKKKNEKIVVSTPRGSVEYVITDIA